MATRADTTALAALLVLVLAFSAPLFAHPGKMRDPENGDSLNYYLHLELARRSIIHHGQFPWWTPYVRGGIPLVGHPRDVSLSPVVLPARCPESEEINRLAAHGRSLLGLTLGPRGVGFCWSMGD